jgi:2'-5' RNA ligase
MSTSNPSPNPTEPLPQGDYRVFVGAFPKGELGKHIQALRQRYDPPTARITSPHVTLAGTYWRSGPGTPNNEVETIAKLNAVAGQILVEALGEDKHQDFQPHLTLAMRLSGAAVNTMLVDLRNSQWETQRWVAPIRELRLMQRGPGEPAWRSIAIMDLGKE